jgi:ComF family protein
LGNPNLSDRRPTCEVRRERRRKIMKDYRVAVLFNPTRVKNCRRWYDEVAQRLILPFKYADRTEAARGIARLMQRPGAELLAAADVLVPVPLHKTRLRTRRYNQAALLARELARRTARLCIPDALIRRRATAPLAGMDLAARRAEMQDAIRIRPGFVANSKHVLLIDDVMTSGTTANACALALLEAGAAQVDVLTAARVADPRFA